VGCQEAERPDIKNISPNWTMPIMNSRKVMAGEFCRGLSSGRKRRKARARRTNATKLASRPPRYFLIRPNEKAQMNDASSRSAMFRLYQIAAGLAKLKRLYYKLIYPSTISPSTRRMPWSITINFYPIMPKA
jgi:hypothetical protein